MLSSFDYAIVRVVPRVEREEFINVGVVVFCAQQNFLGARAWLNEARFAAFSPHTDVELVQGRLNGLLAICSGDENAGPVARLSPSQRFHWVVSPKSTMLQLSPVHSGTCLDPSQALARLFRHLCL